MRFPSVLSALLMFQSLNFLQAQIQEFNSPEILSFEEGVFPASGDIHSSLSISKEHQKHLSSSLSWKWSAPGAQLSIHKNMNLNLSAQKKQNGAIPTFIFWIYNQKPLSGDQIKFEFLKDGRICCYFEYGMNFSGWRGAWVAFDRDMQGKAEPGMNELRIISPQTPAGEIFLDHLILCSPQDARYHTADFQAPYINSETDRHWLILLKSWNAAHDLNLTQKLNQEEMVGMEKIKQRTIELITEKQGLKPFYTLIDRFNAYRIRKNPDGSIRGLPIFFERYGETYTGLNGPNYTRIYDNPMGISKLNQLLADMAVTWFKSYKPEVRQSISAMYVMLMRHLLDQGFQAGSAMGTLHHLGYSMRQYYTSNLIMEPVLREAGLQNEVQQAMEWFSGTGEVKTRPISLGMDIDAFNTSLIGRLASILMMDDSPEKSRYLREFTRWVNNGFLYSDGTQGAFKVDGCIYHHRHNYPAYAVGGLDGAVNANFLLAGTPWQLEPEGRKNLKQALLVMRTYCNLLTWPLSLSGRHPDGKGSLDPEHFARLALTGSPDYSQKIDADLAAAYIRLVQNRPTSYTRLFEKERIRAEKSPSGNWTYNYSCLNVHRRGNWSVTAMGHSRYLWASEIYQNANMYGRYLNHGNLQLLTTGNPVSNFNSGFNQKGWDWNHFPGTTAAVLPMEQLKADVRNLDNVSGFEEMLLSDESFAGGISLQNRNGAFGMKLHEHDKYNGSLRSRKSWFFFDDRVVGLGTDIESALPSSPVHTTLFQVYLPDKDYALQVNGENIRTFPYKLDMTQGKKIISDGLNNHFFVKSGNVTVSKSNQKSLDEETSEPTQNDFGLAFIDHGKQPKEASYEYMILVQPTSQELQDMEDQYNKNDSPYTVLQQDKKAHIVNDKTTGITGYVLFEGGLVQAKSLILSSSIPCMIMTGKENSGHMVISVCDPDLKFYTGPSDEVFDSQGKREERSVYSRQWINNPSGESVFEITIDGSWKLDAPNEFIQVKSDENGKTVLTIHGKHGLSREAELMRN